MNGWRHGSIWPVWIWTRFQNQSTCSLVPLPAALLEIMYLFLSLSFSMQIDHCTSCSLSICPSPSMFTQPSPMQTRPQGLVLFLVLKSVLEQTPKTTKHSCLLERLKVDTPSFSSDLTLSRGWDPVFQDFCWSSSQSSPGLGFLPWFPGFLGWAGQKFQAILP